MKLILFNKYNLINNLQYKPKKNLQYNKRKK